MRTVRALLQSSLVKKIVLGLYLSLFLILGIYTELKLADRFPIPAQLFSDFKIYLRALEEALSGTGPYSIRAIGPGFLYPPPALLIFDAFQRVHSFFLQVALFSTLNLAMLVLMVRGIARHYGYSLEQTWYWYVLCLAFAPFLELLHVGQINMITLFGLFLLFYFEESRPLLGGFGLGLAILTKVSPVLFFGYLLVNKRFKVIISTLVVILLLTGASILRYGLSPVLEYPDTFRWLLAQLPVGGNSMSLVAKLDLHNLSQIQHRLPLLSQTLEPLFSFFTAHERTVQRVLTLYTFAALLLSGALTFFGKQPREPFFIITGLGSMLSPNVLWYHHFVFFLLPLLIWMVWRRLDRRVVAWCLLGMLLIQVDRWQLTYGLLIHLFGQVSLLAILVWQIMSFFTSRKQRDFSNVLPSL